MDYLKMLFQRPGARG